MTTPPAKTAPGALVLGLGGAVDYEIAWDSHVLEQLVEQYGIHTSELSSSVPVDSERALVVCLLAFLRDGAGGERFIASSEIVEQFAARFNRRITLGGTCVRAAMAMRTLGVTCTLHLVAIDDHVRRLLPEGCAYVCSAQEDSTDPHLIVQFGAGARVRSGDVDVRSPHPNRVIFANDPPNRELVLSEDLGSVLRGAAVFMVAGFNVIQDAGLLDRRLHELLDHMRQLPPEAVVFYEDAGYHVPSLSRQVRDALAGCVDVFSMNEEELQAYVGRHVDLLDVDEVERALRDLRAEIPAAHLVVHTKYWSVAVGEDAEVYRAALRGGITMASTRYCYGDLYGEAEYRWVGGLPVHPHGAQLADQLETRMGTEVCCVPALVLTAERPTTIGLGDTFVGGFIEAMTHTLVVAQR